MLMLGVPELKCWPPAKNLQDWFVASRFGVFSGKQAAELKLKSVAGPF